MKPPFSSRSCDAQNASTPAVFTLDQLLPVNQDQPGTRRFPAYQAEKPIKLTADEQLGTPVPHRRAIQFELGDNFVGSLEQG
jgi:hypothetical protein